MESFNEYMTKKDITETSHWLVDNGFDPDKYDLSAIAEEGLLKKAALAGTLGAAMLSPFALSGDGGTKYSKDAQGNNVATTPVDGAGLAKKAREKIANRDKVYSTHTSKVDGKAAAAKMRKMIQQQSR